MKLKIKYGKRNITVERVVKCSELQKITGLMFCRPSKAKALLFEFKTSEKRSIHSFFVFFPFLALWMDDDFNVLQSKIVFPFTLRIQPRKAFTKLLEVPLSQRYSDVKNLVDDERFK